MTDGFSAASVAVETDALPVDSIAGVRGGTPFISYVHSLRGLSILLVVACHVVDGAGWGSDAGPLHRLIWALLSNATVPFIFVSGFLFQHLSGRFRYWPYLRRRWAAVVLPYVVVSTPTLLHQYFARSDVFADSSRPAWMQAVYAYATGAHMPVPFWYVPVIALFFCAAPAFLWLSHSRALGVLTGLLFAVAMFLHRPYAHSSVLQSALYFLPAYLLGIAVSQKREAVLAWVDARFTWLSVLACALFALALLSTRHGGAIYSHSPFSTEAGLVDFDLPAKSVATLCLLVWLRRCEARVAPYFSGLANASFGIFFLHEYVVYRLRVFGAWSTLKLSPWGFLVVPACALLVLVTSLALVQLLKRVLGRYSRFVIGC